MQAFSAQADRDASRDSGLCRAGDILKQHTEICLFHDTSPARQKASPWSGEKRESGNQILGFATRPFV